MDLISGVQQLLLQLVDLVPQGSSIRVAVLLLQCKHMHMCHQPIVFSSQGSGIEWLSFSCSTSSTYTHALSAPWIFSQGKDSLQLLLQLADLISQGSGI
jgi:hypothetical protein